MYVYKVELGAWEQRSSQVMPASPLDKVAYFSTSGAGITMRKRTLPTAATRPPPPPQSVTTPPRPVTPVLSSSVAL